MKIILLLHESIIFLKHLSLKNELLIVLKINFTNILKANPERLILLFFSRKHDQKKSHSTPSVICNDHTYG